MDRVLLCNIISMIEEEKKLPERRRDMFWNKLKQHFPLRSKCRKHCQAGKFDFLSNSSPLTICTMMLVPAILLISVICFSSSASAEESPHITVKGVDDLAADADNDGILDFLVISVQVHVKSEGTYTVYGMIGTISSNLITAHNSSYLAVDSGILELKFPGKKIYDSGMNGPYVVQLTITNDEEHISHKHTTAVYSLEDFDPTIPPSPPIPLYNENLTLEFASIMHKPTITFSPTPMKDKYRFDISFDHIIGFKDNGDGVYTDEDIDVVRGDLSQSIWDLSIYQEGSIVQLRFQNTIDLWDVEEMKPVSSVKIKFIFSTNIQGTYKKFDIDMTFSNPMEGVTTFALEHNLEDLTDMTEFNVMENNGEPRVQFLNGGGEEMAYYEWIEEAESFSETNTETIALTQSHTIDGSVMTLYVNYPYDAGTARIFHDPKLGIKALGRTPIIGDENEGDHSVVLFVISILSGGFFIWYTIRSQRRRA